MVAGVAPEDYKKVLNVVSRREALNVAHHLSQPKDVILIAGKGHETYQEIKGERHPFDDYKIAQTIFLKKD
jgi:UDP-N-acetylmuramoyl-L-alanyl-D-glutamate--2,6-diaminopimelate ligase